MDLYSYDLYILDYDGCILDSLPMWRNAASLYVKSLGFTPKDNLDERIPIFTDLYSGELIKKEYNLSMPLEDIMKDIDSFVDMLYPKCPLKKGALDFILELQKRNKIIVVLSASGDHILDLSMESRNLKGSFHMVKSIYNHETLKKSDGSAMEYVRKHFNVKKDKMLMIDDSLANVLGAKTYGIDCIAIYDEYSSMNKEKELEENSIAYVKMEELPFMK